MKKIISIILTVTLLLGVLNINSLATGFTDVYSEDWFYENVTVLVDEGIINGYGNGTFGPDDTMTVDQFIKTMVVALDYNLDNGSTYWAQPFIDKSLELGIVAVDDFSDYKKTISRAEMAMLCERVVTNLEGTKSYSKTDEVMSAITDLSSISSKLEDYVFHMYEIGIITGYPEGDFKPNNTLKRSEACTVIRRVIDESERNPFVIKSAAIIEEYNSDDMVEFSIMINVLKPLGPQYAEVQLFIEKKAGITLANEIIKYVSLKTSYKEPLPEDYTGDPFDFSDETVKLVGKTWDWGTKQIKVISGINEPVISIQGW